jgi:hypothetical protein
MLHVCCMSSDLQVASCRLQCYLLWMLHAVCCILRCALLMWHVAGRSSMLQSVFCMVHAAVLSVASCLFWMLHLPAGSVSALRVACCTLHPVCCAWRVPVASCLFCMRMSVACPRFYKLRVVCCMQSILRVAGCVFSCCMYHVAILHVVCSACCVLHAACCIVSALRAARCMLHHVCCVRCMSVASCRVCMLCAMVSVVHMLHAAGSCIACLLRVVCSACFTVLLHVACRMLRGAGCVLHAASCMLSVANFTLLLCVACFSWLHAVRCMPHAAWCTWREVRCIASISVAMRCCFVCGLLFDFVVICSFRLVAAFTLHGCMRSVACRARSRCVVACWTSRSLRPTVAHAAWPLAACCTRFVAS